MQRLLDILLSGLALVLLSPLLIPIAIILCLTGEGEVFYFQERVGRGGRPIQLFKFATMLKNSPNLGPGTITLKNDPRILPVGRFLRKTKINELPQLLNVFCGDMSVVGPRPQTRRCFNAFPESCRKAIMEVRPGLSGIGSIVFRDEEDLMDGQTDPGRYYDEVIAPYKGALEEWYVARQSLRIYLLLILVTIWVILVPRSCLVWRLFTSLPRPPVGLSGQLGLGDVTSMRA
jgi:lipopolysaccharide/colanic/teichoic acid biosynthesis glycosyltransferase